MSLESHLHKGFTKLLKKHWKFINSQWPEMKPSKYHRTNKKDICDMKPIKEVVVNRLGIIPVFFFLIVLYPFKYHPGPYRNVEKGLLILYHLLKTISYSDMVLRMGRGKVLAYMSGEVCKLWTRLGVGLGFSLCAALSKSRSIPNF